MKKIIVSLFVIETFLVYVYYVRVYRNIHSITTAKQPKVANKVTTLQTLPTSTITQVQPKDSLYKNGTYVGSAADAVYGNIQVQVTITDGEIATINFLQYPHDQLTSISINQQNDPILAQEAIKKQSANVDIVSGATQSSQAFIQSMQAALVKAKFNG